MATTVKPGSTPASNPASGISRRAFISVTAAAGGGLLLGFSLLDCARQTDATATVFEPDAFIRIGGDGLVTMVMPQVEMGQGTYTSIPMLMAEELEVDLPSVRLEHAPPSDKLYAMPLIGFQATGGSTSIRGFWVPLRTAGATARTMLVSAAAAKWGVDASTCKAAHGEVTHPPTGRRLGYGALTAAAAKLPVPTDVPLKDPKDFTLIGTPAKRLDTPDKVNGKAQFGIDTRVPGMHIATVAACPTLGGTLLSVDDTKAKTIPGVRQVVKLDNAVAVIADHMWAAKQGLAALDIKWNDGVNATLTTADIFQELRTASAQAGVAGQKDGDVAIGLAQAARKVEATYELPYLAHATMEPMNCTVHVRPDGCEVWVGCQVLARAQATAAQVTGLPLDKVVVHNHLIGGGFGRRLEIDYVTQATQIAKQVEGPVKVVWTREEDIQHDIVRPAYNQRVTAGLDAHGMLTAWSHRITGSSIIARWVPQAFKNGIDGDVFESVEGPPYDCANVLIEYVRQEHPGIVTGWWRGVGPTHNVFVVESFIDELAAATRQDPVAYRRRMLTKTPRAQAVLDLAAEKAGWGTKLPPGQGRGVAVQFAFGTYMAQVADVTVAKDGALRVTRVVCALDCGQVVNPDTVRAQIEGGVIFGITGALYSEVTLKNGRIEQHNFDNYRMLRMNEAPAIEVYIVPSAEKPGGMGEPGTALLAPAVANAVYAATGKRCRKLPLQPQFQKT
jgi:isoquinoline 1-oxidoreductase beta subunit